MPIKEACTRLRGTLRSELDDRLCVYGVQQGWRQGMIPGGDTRQGQTGIEMAQEACAKQNEKQARQSNQGGTNMGIKLEKLEEQLIRDAAEFDVEMKHLDEDWTLANEAANAAIEADIATLKGKAQATQAKVQAEVEHLDNEAEAKVAGVKHHLQETRERQKTAIEKRIAEARADHAARKAEIEKRMAAYGAKVEAAQENVKQTADHQKAELEKRVAEAKAEHAARKAEIETRIAENEAQAEAEYAAWQAELDAWDAAYAAAYAAQYAAWQAEVDQRAAEIKADNDTRKAKLAQANTLIGEALRP